MEVTMKVIYVAPEIKLHEVHFRESILSGSPGEAGERNGYNDYDEDF